MKNITYISSASHYDTIRETLFVLSGICAHAKKVNISKKLTGIIVYKNKRYFQFLEGPDSEVDEVMQKIQQDERHHDVDIVFECSAKKRIFPKYSMELFNSCNDALPIQLIKKYIKGKSGISMQKLRKLDDFCVSSNNDVVERSVNDFSNCSIKLASWPNFINSGTQPSIEMIDLCMMLLNVKVHYEALLKNNPFEDEEVLKEKLCYLSTSGVLLVEENQAKPTEVNLEVDKSKANIFSLKMKRFLSNCFA